MEIIRKITLFLFSLGILLFLIFATYVTDNFSKFQKPIFEIYNQGDFNMVQSGSLIEIKSGTGEINIKNFNYGDKIFYSYGNINIKNEKGFQNIEISPGIYFFQLNETSKNYKIKSKGFEITNLGPGSFVVNTLNSRKNVVYSKNTILSVDFIDLKKGDKLTNAKLFPKNIIIINPIKNIFVKNSDFLKVKQIFTLSFVNHETGSEKYYENLLQRSDKGKDFIIKVEEYLEKENIDKKNKIETFKNYTFGSIPGEEIISKYFSFFVNKNKKSIYYKNIIIREVNDLITAEKVDIQKINSIYENFENLQSIDKDSAKIIQDIIVYNYINIKNSNTNKISKLNFIKLTDKIISTKKSKNINSLIDLENLFYTKNENIYNLVEIFINNYLKESKISIDGKDEKMLKIYEAESIDYLLYFLENIILNSNKNLDKNIDEIIKLFDTYILISSNFYQYSDEKVKKTGLLTYSKFLNKFIDIIEENYIENGENGLIKIRTGVNIVNKDIILLEKNIQKIFTFFNNNKIVLDPKSSSKDKLLIEKLYPTLDEKYEKYLYALKDYEGYLTIYDNSKNELLSTKSINEDKNKIVLTQEIGYEYIKQFNGIILSKLEVNTRSEEYCENPIKENKKIETENPYCYEIENMIINGKNASMLLFPQFENKISDIVIDGVAKNGSYKLDEKKKQLDEKIKTLKEDEDRNKFLFNNFLLNIIGGGNNNLANNNKNTQEKEEKKEEEDGEVDNAIRYFISSKLLSEYGEFGSIKNEIQINYGNLKVKRVNDKYNINIEKAGLSMKSGQKAVFNGTFTSEYNFSEKHSFINPWFDLYNEKTKKELLLGNKIKIKGEVHINKISETLLNILGQYYNIESIVTEINKNFDIITLNIEYNQENKKIKIDFNHNGDTFNIYMKDSIVDLYKNKNIIKKGIKVNDIKKYLIN